MTVTYNIVPVIEDDPDVGAFIAGIAGLSAFALTLACIVISVKTQFLNHAKIRFTLQLISGISKALQNLLKCFNGTTILTSFVLLSSLPLF